MTISTMTELDFLLLSASERNAVLSSFTNNSTIFEWLFREQEHLKRENGNEMEMYLLIANQQCSKMTILHNECCFSWDLECLFKSNQIISNQIKSNQIILSSITYPIPSWIPSLFPWILVSEGRSKQSSSKHNSQFSSFLYNILFMINVLS